jgi:hypothetical protein
MGRSQVIDDGLFACEPYPASHRGVAGNSTRTKGTYIFVGGRVEAFEFVDMVFSDVGLKAMPVVPLVLP